MVLFIYVYHYLQKKSCPYGQPFFFYLFISLAPRAQSQDLHGRRVIGHCTINVKRISCVWLPDLRARAPRAVSRLTRQEGHRALHNKREADIVRLAARPSGSRPARSLKTYTAGAVRAVHPLFEAEMLRIARGGIPTKKPRPCGQGFLFYLLKSQDLIAGGLSGIAQ